MRLPIADIGAFLADEIVVAEATQRLLDSLPVDHRIVGGKSNLSISGYLDGTAIKWKVFKDDVCRHDSVATENLQTTLKMTDA